MKTVCPQPFWRRFLASFTDERHPAYGQIATVDLKGKPQVRTVHLRYLDDFDAFAFSTSVQSPKWSQLREKPFLSGCYFDTGRQIQFRWESPVELIEGEEKKNSRLIEKMWGLVRIHIRTAYWLEAKQIPRQKWYQVALDLLRPAPNFGVVLLRPRRWDILEVSPEDIRKAKRTFFSLTKQQWTAGEVSPVTTKDI